MAGSGANWSGVPIEAVIDRALGVNPQIRNGLSAYAAMIAEWQASGDGERFLEQLLDSAAAAYRAAGQPGAEFFTFSDGSANFLFDMVRERVVFVWGVTQTVAPNSRDNKYHAGYPRAGKGLNKGHIWAHAQGGREGGPNYFRQEENLNLGRSENGKLWREIEIYLAANAGLSAFVRLIYAAGSNGDRPAEVEYGILSGSGQFRVAIFPN